MKGGENRKQEPENQNQRTGTRADEKRTGEGREDEEPRDLDQRRKGENRMMMDYLQRRDLEILRTLARLRNMTTKEIVAGFFATPTVGRRRIRRLSGLDLVASHRKGVPDDLQYYAWRLTPRGLDVVAEAFPDEPFPDGLAERLADGSLRNIEHRQQLSRLYL